MYSNKEAVDKVIEKHAKWYRVSSRDGELFSYDLLNGWLVSSIVFGTLGTITLTYSLFNFVMSNGSYMNPLVMIAVAVSVICVSMYPICNYRARFISFVLTEYKDEIRIKATELRLEQGERRNGRLLKHM